MRWAEKWHEVEALDTMKTVAVLLLEKPPRQFLKMGECMSELLSVRIRIRMSLILLLTERGTAGGRWI